jgi:hypothetical protein
MLLFLYTLLAKRSMIIKPDRVMGWLSKLLGWRAYLDIFQNDIILFFILKI